MNMLEVADHEQLPVASSPRRRSRRLGRPLPAISTAAFDTYVFELIHEEQSALDIVQETFIAATRHIGSLRENHKFGSWLFGAVS